MIKKSDVLDAYGLSPMQEGMLFHYVMDGDSTAYFEQNHMEIDGVLDLGVLERSFDKVIENHDVLRTVFVFKKVKAPIQFVLKKRKGKVVFHDITGMAEEEKEAWIKNYAREDRAKGFDLSKDVPTRISVIKVGESRYRLLWSFHHIVLDGWSMGLLMSEFFEAYGLLMAGRNVPGGGAAPYGAYIKWLKKQDKSKGLRFWREYLTDYEETAVLPFEVSTKEDEGRDVENGENVDAVEAAKDAEEAEHANGYESGNVVVEFSEAESAGLVRLARENEVTVNAVFRALWGVLLQNYNNTWDVVFGAVVSGRPPEIRGIEKMVGLFINAVPVRVRLEVTDDGMENTTRWGSFSELCGKVHGEAVEAKSFEYLPLAEVQALSSLKGELLDHLLVFENQPMQEQLEGLMQALVQALVTGMGTGGWGFR